MVARRLSKYVKPALRSPAARKRAAATKKYVSTARSRHSTEAASEPEARRSSYETSSRRSDSYSSSSDVDTTVMTAVALLMLS